MSAPRTLRQAIEGSSRCIIHHSLRRGWSADAIEGAVPAQLKWYPTLWEALDCVPTDEEKAALDRAALALPARAWNPPDWPCGDRYAPPPPETCDYVQTWEWWPAQCPSGGWFRGSIEW